MNNIGVFQGQIIYDTSQDKKGVGCAVISFSLMIYGVPVVKQSLEQNLDKKHCGISCDATLCFQTVSFSGT